MLEKQGPHQTVVAVLQAIAGKEETLKNALSAVVALRRAEQGCIEYRLHQDKNNPGQFILYEQWADAEIHAAQFKKPYLIELAEQLKVLLAKPYQVFFAHELI